MEEKPNDDGEWREQSSRHSKNVKRYQVKRGGGTPQKQPGRQFENKQQYPVKRGGGTQTGAPPSPITTRVIDKSMSGPLVPMGKTFDFASPTMVVDFAVCGSSQTQGRGLIDGYPTTIVTEIAYSLVSPNKTVAETMHVNFIHYNITDAGEEARMYFGKFFNGIGLDEQRDGMEFGPELAAMMKIVKDEKAQIICTHAPRYWKLVGNALGNTGIFPHVGSRPQLPPCWFCDDLEDHSKDGLMNCLVKLPGPEAVLVRQDELDLEERLAGHLQMHQDKSRHCCLWPVFREAMVLKDLMTKASAKMEAKTD